MTDLPDLQACATHKMNTETTQALLSPDEVHTIITVSLSGSRAALKEHHALLNMAHLRQRHKGSKHLHRGGMWVAVARKWHNRSKGEKSTLKLANMWFRETCMGGGV